MANEKVIATAEEVVEKVSGSLALHRKKGSFVNKDGEMIEYEKYVLLINGAEVGVVFDKDVKNLLGAFIKFEKI